MKKIFYTLRGGVGAQLFQLSYALHIKKIYGYEVMTNPHFIDTSKIQKEDGRILYNNLIKPHTGIDFDLTPHDIGRLYCLGGPPFSEFLPPVELLEKEDNILLTGEYKSFSHVDQAILSLIKNAIPTCPPSPGLIDLSWDSVPSLPGVTVDMIRYWQKSVRSLEEVDVVASSLESPAVDIFISLYGDSIPIKIASPLTRISMGMSAKYVVGSNSSESWWAAYLGENAHTLPRRWVLNSETDYWSKGLFPKCPRVTIA